MDLISSSKQGNVAIVKPQVKRLDASVALSFRESVLSVVGEGENALVLDLEAVQFMDSSGLGALVSILKALGAKGMLAVCNVNTSVMSLFRLTRMDKVFTIMATPADAIGQLTA